MLGVSVMPLPTNTIFNGVLNMMLVGSGITLTLTLSANTVLRNKSDRWSGRTVFARDG